MYFHGDCVVSINQKSVNVLTCEIEVIRVQEIIFPAGPVACLGEVSRIRPDVIPADNRAVQVNHDSIVALDAVIQRKNLRRIRDGESPAEVGSDEFLVLVVIIIILVRAKAHFGGLVIVSVAKFCRSATPAFINKFALAPGCSLIRPVIEIAPCFSPAYQRGRKPISSPIDFYEG